MVRRKQAQQARTLHLIFPQDQVSYKFEQEARENPVVQEVIRMFDARIVVIDQLLPVATTQCRGRFTAPIADLSARPVAR